jgi:hypothetical protein
MSARDVLLDTVRGAPSTVDEALQAHRGPTSVTVYAHELADADAMLRMILRVARAGGHEVSDDTWRSDEATRSAAQMLAALGLVRASAARSAAPAPPPPPLPPGVAGRGIGVRRR